MTDPTSAAQLRAAIAFSGLPNYQVAARIQLHPSRLSTLLRSNGPVPAHIGRKILEVLKTKEELVRL